MWATRSWRPLVRMRCICRRRANPFWTVQKRLFDIYGSCSPAAFKIIENASVKVCFEPTSFFQTFKQMWLKCQKNISAFLFSSLLSTHLSPATISEMKKNFGPTKKKLFFRRRWIKQPSVFGGRGPFPESGRKSRKSQFISFLCENSEKNWRELFQWK